MTPRRLTKRTESYNNAGVFLHAYVVQKFRDAGWHTDIEYPVTVAPFITDPTRLEGRTTLPNGNLGVLSGRFVNSIQKSQNLSEVGERSIDVISARPIISNHDLKVCIECKKLNPKY